MFEKLFGKNKKKNDFYTKRDLEQPLATSPIIEEHKLEQSSANSLNFEEVEIKKEREKAEKINQEIQKLDKQIVLDVEKRIREEYSEEFDADPSDIEECYEQLEDIRDQLLFEVENRDEVLRVLEGKIILSVFEEKLISIGSSLEAYYEWEQNDYDSEENTKDAESDEVDNSFHI